MTVIIAEKESMAAKIAGALDCVRRHYWSYEENGVDLFTKASMILKACDKDLEGDSIFSYIYEVSCAKARINGQGWTR